MPHSALAEFIGALVEGAIDLLSATGLPLFGGGGRTDAAVENTGILISVERVKKSLFFTRTVIEFEGGWHMVLDGDVDVPYESGMEITVRRYRTGKPRVVRAGRTPPDDP